MATPREQFLAAALEHAKKRWCWDDTTLIAEAFDRDWDEMPRSTTPTEWIDHLAEKFDLLDPQEYR